MNKTDSPWVGALATAISRQVEVQYAGAIAQVPLRIPQSMSAMLQAMGEASGMSRNKVIWMLCEAGISATLDELSDDKAEALRDRAAALVSDALATAEQGAL